MHSRDDRTASVSAEIARQVIGRAAALDAADADAVSVERLHEIAYDVGISPGAMQRALHEHAEAATGEGEPPVPWWVRCCIFGVPDRASALRFYWIFVGGLLASPLLLRVTRAPLLGRWLAVVTLLFCLFASWSTWRAVRWLDRHGWHRLP